MFTPRSALRLLASVAVLSAAANSQTLQTLETFKGPAPSTCVAPLPNYTFSPADSTVNAYFFLSGMNTNGGDAAALYWFAPNGSWVRTTWTQTTSGYSQRCFSTNLDIAQWIAPDGWGTWQLQVYVNGNPIGSPLAIQVNNAGSPSSGAGPLYAGSFDSIDCTHAYGWAKDNANPNSSISVDIYIDHVFWATVIASDSRSDLAAAGIGNHAWNEYNLPSTIYDGNQHRISAVYSGTITHLQNSPRYFQNTCNANSGSPPSGQSWDLMSQQQRNQAIINAGLNGYAYTPGAREALYYSGLDCKLWIQQVVVPTASGNTVTIPRTDDATGYQWNPAPHIYQISSQFITPQQPPNLAALQRGWILQVEETVWFMSQYNEPGPHTAIVLSASDQGVELLDSNWVDVGYVGVHTISAQNFVKYFAAYSVYEIGW